MRAPTKVRDFSVLTLGMLLGATFMLGAAALAGSLSEPASEEAIVSSRSQTAELPREWRWERKAIDFDHMYRSR